MHKWKITYIDYGTVRADIIRSDILNLGMQIQGTVPDVNNVIKIERVLEADSENITDLTKD